MVQVGPTVAAQAMIERLKQDGLYKGFTLIDIKPILGLTYPKAATKTFVGFWAKRRVKSESIGWRWLGTHSEDPSLLVAYKGAMSPGAAFQLCSYVFGGRR
jgi:hypothetical protein